MFEICIQCIVGLSASAITNANSGADRDLYYISRTNGLSAGICL